MRAMTEAKDGASQTERYDMAFMVRIDPRIDECHTSDENGTTGSNNE